EMVGCCTQFLRPPGKPLYRIDFIPNVTPKSAGSCRIPTERHNEKTRQKAGFTGVPEILVAFAGT
ncbi:hypothetical protein, partial [Pseudomonas aeruginosa]